MRLIDADAFKEWVDEYYDCTDLGAIVMSWIDERPTVARDIDAHCKRGRWESGCECMIHAGVRKMYMHCSVCGGKSIEAGRYCPQCGAKMEV